MFEKHFGSFFVNFYFFFFRLSFIFLRFVLLLLIFFLFCFHFFVFFFTTFVSIAVHIQVFDFMKNDVGTLEHSDFFEALLEKIWSYYDIPLILVCNYNNAFVLSSHHEGLPEVCLVLKTGFKLLHGVNGEIALVALTSSFYGDTDVQTHSKSNGLVGQNLNLLIIVFFIEWCPGGALTSEIGVTISLCLLFK
jgi:hypothetical protein